MNSSVHPELPTAPVCSSQAPTATVDNVAPSVPHPNPTYKSGKVVRTSGATSVRRPLKAVTSHTFYKVTILSGLN